MSSLYLVSSRPADLVEDRRAKVQNRVTWAAILVFLVLFWTLVSLAGASFLR